MEINIIGSGSIGATDMSASTLIDKKILIDVPTKWDSETYKKIRL